MKVVPITPDQESTTEVRKSLLAEKQKGLSTIILRGEIDPFASALSDEFWHELMPFHSTCMGKRPRERVGDGHSLQVPMPLTLICFIDLGGVHWFRLILKGFFKGPIVGPGANRRNFALHNSYPDEQ